MVMAQESLEKVYKVLWAEIINKQQIHGTCTNRSSGDYPAAV